jgi:hypothetical protein
MRGEQGIEAGAQGLVVATLAVEPGVALVGWLREREGEQGFFVRGKHGLSCYGTAHL